MTNKDELKEGKKMTYVTKNGLNDENGNVIIPMEYDYISEVTPNLYVATKGKMNGLLRSAGGDSFFAEELKTYTDKSIENNKTLDSEVHFYSLLGRLEINKKIRGCIHCTGTETFLLLDENYKWSIGYVNYAEKRIVENKTYNGFGFIVQNYKNRKFSFIKDNKFIGLSLDKGDFVSQIFSLENGAAMFYPKGIVAELAGKSGFMNYDGEFILEYGRYNISPYEDYIGVEMNNMKGIYSYTGKEIIPCEYYNILQRRIAGDYVFMVEKANENYVTKLGLYTKNSEQLLAPVNDKIQVDSSGYIIVNERELYKYNPKSSVLSVVSPSSLYNIKQMKFVYKNGNTFICVQKGFRYALFDLCGYQLSPYRFKFMLSSEEKLLYK